MKSESHRRLLAAFCIASSLTLGGCASQSAPPAASPATSTVSQPSHPTKSKGAAASGVIAKNERFVIYRAQEGDSLRSITQHFTSDDRRTWEIAAFNGLDKLKAGSIVAIPLRPLNPTGVFPDGYQTVPILAYHRFGAQPGKMVVTAQSFSAQLQYLADNGYHVIPLSELEEFLTGQHPIPPRSVVITIDDGYVSAYEQAYPILTRHRFPATLFVYTDFMGAKDALTWAQMEEMASSGLIDIQSHSKSHESLTVRLADETERDYRARVNKELTAGRDLLQKKLDRKVVAFAYPYGDTNGDIVERLRTSDYRMAVTVNPGGNPFFARSLVLRRTMIFGDYDLNAFKARLQTYREANLK